jgi:hypothetical protein
MVDINITDARVGRPMSGIYACVMEAHRRWFSFLGYRHFRSQRTCCGHLEIRVRGSTSNRYDEKWIFTSKLDPTVDVSGGADISNVAIVTVACAKHDTRAKANRPMIARCVAVARWCCILRAE